MQYPIFITVAQATKLLAVGKTTIYRLILSKKLRAAKINSGTRITFASVIEYALEELAAVSGVAELSEILVGESAALASMMAERYATQLCYIHQGPTVIQTEEEYYPEPTRLIDLDPRSSTKNSAGEF